MDNVRIKLLSTERHHLQFEEANGDISNEDTENILVDVSRRPGKVFHPGEKWVWHALCVV